MVNATNDRRGGVGRGMFACSCSELEQTEFGRMSLLLIDMRKVSVCWPVLRLGTLSPLSCLPGLYHGPRTWNQYSKSVEPPRQTDELLGRRGVELLLAHAMHCQRKKYLHIETVLREGKRWKESVRRPWSEAGICQFVSLSVCPTPDPRWMSYLSRANNTKAKQTRWRETSLREFEVRSHQPNSMKSAAFLENGKQDLLASSIEFLVSQKAQIRISENSVSANLTEGFSQARYGSFGRGVCVQSLPIIRRRMRPNAIWWDRMRPVKVAWLHMVGCHSICKRHSLPNLHSITIVSTACTEIFLQRVTCCKQSISGGLKRNT